MILSFTAINKQVQQRHFWCQLPELEIALDVLTTIAFQGDTLLEAHIVDGHSRIILPLEAFDGEPFSSPIQQLQAQWETILNEPAGSVLPKHGWYKDLTRRRIKLYEDRIAQLTLTVNRFEQIRQRVVNTNCDDPTNARLVRHYDFSLTKYRQYIDQAKAGCQVAQEKLCQLERCP